MFKTLLQIYFQTQASNYANFYDDARQSWSVLHDSEQNAIQFGKFVSNAIIYFVCSFIYFLFFIFFLLFLE